MTNLRSGLIGYGAWGSHHARVMAADPKSELVAIAAHSEASQVRVRQEHPACRVYGDYQEMLRQETLDAVVIALPSDLHFAASRAVLDSGRHLLLEKPMCLTVADCETLNEVARNRGLVLAVGHEMRHSSLWGKVKEQIDSGTVGRPLYAHIELWRRPYRLGADGWRYGIDRVGSWILEEPIHFFDLVRWYFAGHAEPVSVYARANAARAERPELQDHFGATVNFSGGQFAVIAQCLSGWEHHQTVKVAGSDGALWATWSGAMDRTFAPAYSLKVHHGTEVEDIPIARAAGEVFELAEQWSAFLNAIETKSAPAVTGADGTWSVRLCLKAKESVQRGIAVTI